MSSSEVRRGWQEEADTVHEALLDTVVDMDRIVFIIVCKQ